jgi:hypothetical protein
MHFEVNWRNFTLKSVETKLPQVVVWSNKICVQNPPQNMGKNAKFYPVFIFPENSIKSRGFSAKPPLSST